MYVHEKKASTMKCNIFENNDAKICNEEQSFYTFQEHTACKNLSKDHIQPIAVEYSHGSAL